MGRPQNASLDTDIEFFNCDIDTVMNTLVRKTRSIIQLYKIPSCAIPSLTVCLERSWKRPIIEQHFSSGGAVALFMPWPCLGFWIFQEQVIPCLQPDGIGAKKISISILLSKLRVSTGHRTDSRFYYSGKPQKLWPNVVTFTRSVFYWIFGWLWFWDCGIGDHLALLSPWQNGKDFLYLTGIFCRLGFYDNITQQYNSLWLGIELTKMSSHFN